MYCVLFCMTFTNLYAQRDTSEQKKILTGYSVGMSLFDMGVAKHEKELNGISFYAAAELYNRFYVGIYGLPIFAAGLFYESFDEHTKDDYPLYDIFGSSFGVFCRPCLFFRRIPVTVSLPLHLSCINIRVREQYWVSEFSTDFKRIINKYRFGIRPGIMIEARGKRFSMFMMYSHSFCFCKKLIAPYTQTTVYNDDFCADWMTFGFFIGNYFKNPKCKIIN